MFEPDTRFVFDIRSGFGIDTITVPVNKPFRVVNVQRRKSVEISVRNNIGISVGYSVGTSIANLVGFFYKKWKFSRIDAF